MREAKYRHWDGEQMIYQSKTHSFNIGGPHGNELLTWLGFDMIGNEPIDNLMQFIDKKDTDGIDVCEGDVIQYWELYECHSDAVDYFDVEPQNNFAVDEVFFELKTGVVELVDGAFKVNGTCIFDIGEYNKYRIIDNHYQGSLGLPLKDFVYDCYERGITKPLSKGLGAIKIIGNTHQNPELMENKQ